jgi:TPR repeat protein
MMSMVIDVDQLEEVVARSIGQAPSYPVVRIAYAGDGAAGAIGGQPNLDAVQVRAAAVNGSVEAQVAWGHLLLSGHGVERDAAAAVRWFQIASRRGNADAFNMLGRCHELGWGVPVNSAEAARWYRLAADQSHAWAQFNLAVLLAQGNGVAADSRAALALLVRSARQGNAKAMNMIGRFRELGYDRKPKMRSAALWYRWAAVRGCFRGRFHHARQLAAAGDIEAARRWFSESLSEAPLQFRSEAVEILSRHADPNLRLLAMEFGLDKGAESMT